MISQKKHINELLKRFDMKYVKYIDTSIVNTTKPNVEGPGSLMNKLIYDGIFGSFLLLIDSRPDAIFSVGLCA